MSVRLRWALVAAGVVLAASETRFFLMSGSNPAAAEAVLCLAGLCLAVAVALGGRAAGPGLFDPGRSGPWLVFGCCLLAGLVGGLAWPNSGDEYSNTYLARTLLEGRATNPAPPPGDLFRLNHVGVDAGRAFSRYMPGWPLVLTPFIAAHATWLAGPAVAGAMAWCLQAVLRRLAAPEVAAACWMLAMFTPFVAFTGASLYPHCFVTLLVLLVILLELDDDGSPAAWRKVLIGALFGVMLNTRYEVFFVVAAPYAMERVLARRQTLLSDAALLAAGLAPFVLCIATYNAALTGSPMRLPFVAAALPDELAVWARNVGSVVVSLHNLLYYAAIATIFGAFWLLLLVPAALWRKAAGGRLRFYDFILPTTFVIVSTLPFNGGHQYGPRYYFTAFVAAALTVATSVPDIARLRRYAAASQTFGLGGFAALLVIMHFYVEARHQVYEVQPPQRPAVVLIPDRQLMVWPWQGAATLASRFDFTRNGTDMGGEVLYGSVGDARDVEEACRLGRPVFLWRPPGALAPLDCLAGHSGEHAGRAPSR